MTESRAITAPGFVALPTLPDSEERHAWDVWGRDDQIGSLNWIGPEQIVHACHLVERGEVYLLSYALNEPNPGPSAIRKPYEHYVSKGRNGADDRLDGLYPQYTSQWDGLRHVGYRQYGFWGGRQRDDLDTSDDIGIDHWARRGLIGRGVFLDVKSHQERHGIDLPADVAFEISPALMEEVAAEEGVGFEDGDFIIFRTGWMEWFVELPPDLRLSMQKESLGTHGCPGLAPHRESAAWLWDHRVAGIAADNRAVEVEPVTREAGFLHHRMIPLLGLAVGEMWRLSDLAVACERLGRYEFLLASAPLNVPAGVGSPANAYAIL